MSCDQFAYFLLHASNNTTPVPLLFTPDCSHYITFEGSRSINRTSPHLVFITQTWWSDCIVTCAILLSLCRSKWRHRQTYTEKHNRPRPRPYSLIHSAFYHSMTVPWFKWFTILSFFRVEIVIHPFKAGARRRVYKSSGRFIWVIFRTRNFDFQFFWFIF